MTSNELSILLQEAHIFINGPGTELSFNPRCKYCGQLTFHAYCCSTALRSIDSCISIFTRQQPEQLIWQKRLQDTALQRWHQWFPTVDVSLREDGLDLQFLFLLFDDYFFQGRTKYNTTVEWAEYHPNFPILGWTSVPDAQATIYITRLHPERVWTRQSVKGLLSTLLHEMAHAFVMLKWCNCSTCRCPANICGTRGVSGHGPSWVKLCEAMEAEASRSLAGLCGRWDLDCKQHGGSLRIEREELEIWDFCLTMMPTLDGQ